jgi:glycosyltransferase involved in cell wall biosynthesis
MISIVSPIYNEAENLPELYERITAACQQTQEDYEILLVENGSYDRSLEIIKALRAKDPHVKFVSLSRNFTSQGGIWAGLTHASGDAVISLDGDLQHPPELIPRMVSLWQEGYDVVYTLKTGKIDPFNLRLLLTKAFYRFISAISELTLSYGQSDFRLLDRKVVDVLCHIPEHNKFLRGMVQWVGFRQISIDYTPEPRKRGESKFSLRNYFTLALNGIISFSTVPLQLVWWVGLMMTILFGILDFGYVLIGLLHYLTGNNAPVAPVWLPIVISIFFAAGIQLLCLGILGEYIGRIFLQIKARPDFIVKEQELD